MVSIGYFMNYFILQEPIMWRFTHSREVQVLIGTLFNYIPVQRITFQLMEYFARKVG